MHRPATINVSDAVGLLGLGGGHSCANLPAGNRQVPGFQRLRGPRSSQIGDGTTTFRNTPTTINVGGAVGLLALGNSLSLTCESDGQHDPQVLGLHDRGGDCGSGSRLQELQITSRSPGARWNIVSTDRVQVRSRVAGRYRDGNFLPAVAPPERLVDLDPRPRACASPGAAHPPHRAHIARSEPSERQSSRETITSQNSTAVYNEDKTRSNDLAPQTPHPRSPIHAAHTRSYEIEIAIQRPRRHQHIRGHQYMPSRSRATSCAHDDTNTSEVTKSEGPVSPGPLSRFCLKASRRNRRRPWPSSPQSSS